jgi:hypothetical protein
VTIAGRNPGQRLSATYSARAILATLLSCGSVVRIFWGSRAKNGTTANSPIISTRRIGQAPLSRRRYHSASSGRSPIQEMTHCIAAK